MAKENDRDAQLALLQHLRYIHFSFVLAAAAIVLALSTSNTTYDLAIRQLRDVVQLKDALRSDDIAQAVMRETDGGETLEAFWTRVAPDWLETQDIYADVDIRYITIDLSDPDALIDNFREEYEYENSWLKNRSALLASADTIHTSAYRLPAQTGPTVEGAQDALNSLLSIADLYQKPEFYGGYLVPDNEAAPRYMLASEDIDWLNDQEQVDVSAVLKGIVFASANDRAAFQLSREEIVEDPAGYYRHGFRFDELALDLTFRTETGERRSMKALFPVMFEKSAPGFMLDALSGPQMDTRYRARYLAGARDFAGLFPELTAAASTLFELPPTTMERWLDERRKTEGAPISVLGLTVKRELIEIWGVVLMLAIKLYFCMHFQALCDLAPAGAPRFPWIALYPQKIASLVFQISLAAPLMAVTYAAMRSTSQGFQMLDIAVAGICLALFLWAEMTYWRLRASQPRT